MISSKTWAGRWGDFCNELSFVLLMVMIMVLVIWMKTFTLQVADISCRAGKVQGRVVGLQEKVQKHNPKKEKLREYINHWLYMRRRLFFVLAFLWKC